MTQRGGPYVTRPYPADRPRPSASRWIPLFEYLVADPDFNGFEHVWVLENGPEHDGFRKRCESLPNVEFVRRGTLEYFHRLLTAQYVFSNSAFPLEYTKPAGQVYVNTWHGIPLKTMGYDLPGGAIGTRNVVRTFLAADYLLSSGPSMTQTMYRDAFQLGGLYQGSVIETGLPRMADQAAADPHAVRRLNIRFFGVHQSCVWGPLR